MRLIETVVLFLGLAATQAAAQSRVTLSPLPNKAYELHGDFEVESSSADVWTVLTDYEGIPGFVSSMRSSRVREAREDGSLLVEQKAVGGMFFLTRTVTILLEVRRSPAALDFEDIGREDFWRYEGGWKTEETPTGVKVSYRLIAQPDFAVPAVLMGRVMRRGAQELLNEVRAEIVRRTDVQRKKL